MAASCGGATTPTSPSNVTAAKPGAVTIALSGSVRDAQSGSGIPGASVQVLTGPDASKSTPTDGSGAFSLTGLKPGSFRIRAEGPGHEIVERNVSAAQDVRMDVLLRPGASCAALPAPTGFRASVTGGTHVTFNWNAVTGVKEYIVGVGTYPNGRNVIAPNTTQTTYSWRSAPPGSYYARVLARADCPHENESTEITFSVLMPTP